MKKQHHINTAFNKIFMIYVIGIYERGTIYNDIINKDFKLLYGI